MAPVAESRFFEKAPDRLSLVREIDSQIFACCRISAGLTDSRFLIPDTWRCLSKIGCAEWPMNPSELVQELGCGSSLLVRSNMINES